MGRPFTGCCDGGMWVDLSLGCCDSGVWVDLSLGCCDSECGSTFRWGVVIVSVGRPFDGVL